MKESQRRGKPERLGRAVYHHEQPATGLDIRPGDIIVMPGGRGVTAWRVVNVTSRITIAPLKSEARKKKGEQGNEQ